MLPSCPSDIVIFLVYRPRAFYFAAPVHRSNDASQRSLKGPQSLHPSRGRQRPVCGDCVTERSSPC
jgi:hypothetical protein